MQRKSSKFLALFLALMFLPDLFQKDDEEQTEAVSE